MGAVRRRNVGASVLGYEILTPKRRPALDLFSGFSVPIRAQIKTLATGALPSLTPVLLRQLHALPSTRTREDSCKLEKRSVFGAPVWALEIV